MPKDKISDLSFSFALRMIELYRFLVKNSEYVISKQLLKSGTSVGANVQEASAACSKKDFIQKMSIASKEARETKYWLSLLHRSQIVKGDYSAYIKDIESIINVLTKIVKTAQANLMKE
jgi:four helix bundle protein